MKLELNEATLNAYINEAIDEELDEIWGLSRSEMNDKWGYRWDDNLTNAQNRAQRKLNKANIKAKGYRNAQEYEAGEGHAYGQEAPQEPEQPVEQPVQEIPSQYPYKSDKQKTGQFQTWFNENMGGKLVVDGIWGPKTEAAYQQWLQSM